MYGNVRSGAPFNHNGEIVHALQIVLREFANRDTFAHHNWLVRTGPDWGAGAEDSLQSKRTLLC